MNLYVSWGWHQLLNINPKELETQKLRSIPSKGWWFEQWGTYNMYIYIHIFFLKQICVRIYIYTHWYENYSHILYELSWLYIYIDIYTQHVCKHVIESACIRNFSRISIIDLSKDPETPANIASNIDPFDSTTQVSKSRMPSTQRHRRVLASTFWPWLQWWSLGPHRIQIWKVKNGHMNTGKM